MKPGNIAWGIASAIALAQLLSWTLDREPPFRRISATASPTRPGGTMRVDAVVWRDLTRYCSITYGRYLWDSTGFRHVIVDGGIVSDQERRDYKKADEMHDKIVIPPGAAPGPGVLEADLNYVCNPVHFLRPIHVKTEIAVEILP